jgi:hypothetical protein
LAGLFDKLLVKRAVERALRKTTKNLDRVFQVAKGARLTRAFEGADGKWMNITQG